jgi:DNA-binding NarL/FixJ family response regulator
MQGETRILVVDDHALIRDMLAERLKSELDLTVVGRAGTADEGLALAKECRPGIIVMDIDMPGRSCFDAARTLKAVQPKARIIFLSAYVQDHYVAEALDVGAWGYLTKSETVERVVAAIREVAAGGVCFSKEVQARITIDSSGARLGDRPKSRASMLTRREKEVLAYIAKGLEKCDIAETMHLSPKTIDHHTTKIMRKLNIHRRVGLARFAIREGIIEA